MAHAGRRNADDLLAAALAAGSTVREAANLAGVAERTAHRRNSDPEFRRRVAIIRGRTVEAAMGRLTEAMCDASEALRRLLDAESESVRLGAARSILEMGMKLRESVDFEARIAALEGDLLDEEELPDEEDLPGEASEGPGAGGGFGPAPAATPDR